MENRMAPSESRRKKPRLCAYRSNSRVTYSTSLISCRLVLTDSPGVATLMVNSKPAYESRYHRRSVLLFQYCHLSLTPSPSCVHGTSSRSRLRAMETVGDSNAQEKQKTYG